MKNSSKRLYNITVQIEIEAEDAAAAITSVYNHIYQDDLLDCYVTDANEIDKE